MAPFDLENAIASWKTRYAENEAVSPDTLAELENHLRDSVTHLQRTNLLPEDEAFVLAEYRLGTPHELLAEYGKVHQGRVWLGRVIFMLLGYFIMRLLLKAVA